MSGRDRGGGGGNWGGGGGPRHRGGGDHYGGGGRGGDRGGFHDRRGPPPPDYYHQRRPPPPPRGGPRHGGPPRGGHNRPNNRHKNNTGVVFRSYDEEREWVEERRRKRRERPSKFDVLPDGTSSAEQAAALALMPMTESSQQTRHARRLYVGNLPLNVTEDSIHTAFREAIEASLEGPALEDDPILTVYINHERRFAFLEFRTVEMTTACMTLDGLVLEGQTLKVKRPNDYNALTAPKIHPSAIPSLDVSKLGIISGTVLDGPNKIFIGGLHYHLAESQVMELLQAFGKIKAFHLVKNDPDSDTSKGYCFVEYVDPNITNIAVKGLNDMDIGGGKSLTARLAGERTPGMDIPGMFPSVPATPGVPPPDRTVVAGYDVEALVDAAMGHGTMPMGPLYFDPMGQPLTRMATMLATPAVSAPPPPKVAAPSTPVVTRILVLLNMVTDDDLATDEDHQGLTEEVKEECAKFGRLLNIKIPKEVGGGTQPTAIRKIFLEYTTTQEAMAAERELNGRKFGEAIVHTSYYPEDDFAANILR